MVGPELGQGHRLHLLHGDYLVSLQALSGGEREQWKAELGKLLRGNLRQSSKMQLRRPSDTLVVEATKFERAQTDGEYAVVVADSVLDDDEGDKENLAFGEGDGDYDTHTVDAPAPDAKSSLNAVPVEDESIFATITDLLADVGIHNAGNVSILPNTEIKKRRKTRRSVDLIDQDSLLVRAGREQMVLQVVKGKVSQ